LRILQVNNYHYPRGGSDRYFLQVTELLKNERHIVGTFSTGCEQTINKEWFVVQPSDGVDTNKAGDINNIRKFLFSSENRKKMSDVVKVFKPDIAHLHIYYGQLTASILAPLHEAGIPIVQTLHEYKLVCPTHGLYANGSYCDACQGRQYWHSLLRRCNRGSVMRSALSMMEAYVSDILGSKDYIDRFIAVSEFQKQQLIRLGVSDKKLTVLNHFIDTVPVENKMKGYYFLYVGRITKDKGIKVLLDAYALLDDGRLPLMIVGEGEELENWKSYSVKLGLSNDVKWLGFKNGSELDEFYQKSLVLINPSLLNETFGLTCLEALARGKPVIASHVGAFPEVVSDGVDGVLVDADDAAALALAMKEMVTQPNVALNMGQKGLEKVKNRFSRHHHYHKLMEIYNEVINSSDKKVEI